MSIQRASKARKAIAPPLGWDGPQNGALPPDTHALVAQLSGEIVRLKQELEEARTRLESAERAADKDHLLPVLNRRAFMRALSRQIGHTARYGTTATLLYLDLDGFKGINDSFGHAAGDAALRHIAELLTRNVRDSDVVGRLGGDEFGVVLAHATKAQAEKKAQILIDALSARPLLWEGRPLPVGFSFGAFELVAHTDAETSLMRADAAMYASKRAR